VQGGEDDQDHAEDEPLGGSTLPQCVACESFRTRIQLKSYCERSTFQDRLGVGVGVGGDFTEACTHVSSGKYIAILGGEIEVPAKWNVQRGSGRTLEEPGCLRDGGWLGRPRL